MRLRRRTGAAVRRPEPAAPGPGDAREAAAVAVAARVPRRSPSSRQRELEGIPLRHLVRAKPVVEVNRRLVPRQDRPFHAAAATVGADLRDVRKQLLPEAATAPPGFDEQ